MAKENEKMSDKIVIKGARTHNLKNITVDPAPNFGLVKALVTFSISLTRHAMILAAYLTNDVESQSWFMGGQQK